MVPSLFEVVDDEVDQAQKTGLSNADVRGGNIDFYNTIVWLWRRIRLLLQAQ
jgi:hypothetical protein